MEQDEFYVRQDGERRGPFTMSRMRELWLARQITASAEYAKTGSELWQPIDSIRGILDGSVLLPVLTGSDSDMIGAADEYSRLPWYRQSGWNVLLVILGLACGLPLLIPVYALLTGDVYYNKRNRDGSLKRWSMLTRIAVVFYAAVAILIILACIFA